MSLLTLENIYKEYKNQVVLNEVSLRVERGERLALVGPNGSGKSTLIKIAMGLEVCDRGDIIRSKQAKIGYLSQDMHELERACSRGETALEYEKVLSLETKIRTIEEKMKMLSSDEESLEYKNTLNEYSRLINLYETIDGYTVESKIKRTLLGLGLKQEVLNTPISNMSGGEKMRVALTRLLLEEPDLIILDEPTNHLDIQAVEWLEEFLKRFEGGVLFVSHDRYFLDQVATRIAELENGSIIEKSCSYTSFVEQKKYMREFYLKEQKNLSIRIRNENQITQDLRSLGRIKASKSREKEVERLKAQLDNHKNVFKNSEHLYRDDNPKIDLKKVKHVSKDIAFADNLIKSFGDVEIFKGASFHIRGGQKIGIIGDNGCGKTTLINLLLGKDKDYEGLARLGEWVNYSYLGQNIEFEDEKRTILEEILSIKDISELSARNLLSSYQFYGEDVDKRLEVLSGGERVRVFFAEITLKESDCLIMDEPTNHLDLPARDAIDTAIKNFKGTIIAISHDRYFLNNCVERILEIEDGKINSFDGNYEYYKAQKALEKEKLLAVTTEKNSKVKKANPKSKASREEANLKNQEKRNQEKLEAQIAQLENKLKELETSFDSGTSAQKYVEYDNLNNELIRLYDVWESTIDS